MKINLSKDAFTKQEIGFIREKLFQAAALGYIEKRFEKNDYLLLSYKGVREKGITHKWNVKIYTFNMKKNGHSLVCVDKYILGKLLNEDYESFIPPDLQTLSIDDAGWGFPLCGVMVGVSDEKSVYTSVVPMEYFRHDTKNHFKSGKYLHKYSDLAIQILNDIGASPGTHRIEICTGYINQPLRERLRGKGYDVRVVEITGLLQEKLEQLFREYVVREIGSDIYYDPKDMNKLKIPRKYYEALEYGMKNCPDLVKTGWDSIEPTLYEFS